MLTTCTYCKSLLIKVKGNLYKCNLCKREFEVDTFSIEETGRSIMNRYKGQMFCKNCCNWVQGSLSKFCRVSRDDNGLINCEGDSPCINIRKFDPLPKPENMIVIEFNKEAKLDYIDGNVDGIGTSITTYLEFDGDLKPMFPGKSFIIDRTKRFWRIKQFFITLFHPKATILHSITFTYGEENEDE